MSLQSNRSRKFATPVQALDRGATPLVRERQWPIGAEVVTGGGASFRVWAPAVERLGVKLGPEGIRTELQPEPGGYFSGYVAEAAAGMNYWFEVNGKLRPDPASRFQPEGPHGPSQLVDPHAFAWTDQHWKGVPRHGQVLYEMHVATFTEEGTWKAATALLSSLKELGITLIELMPVAEFPGRFGWGYDGVNLFAPTRLYGAPDEFRGFINEAHALGMGVILDVVYNHFGPDGNYLADFSEHYFTDKYKNEWGRALNFDGENNSPVREFFTTNAAYWIKEFHIDGLRLDATQQIFDSSVNHIIGVISRKVREAAEGRCAYLVAENESQHAEMAKGFEKGGYDLDALWNDDFHHSALVAVTGHREAYYTDYGGHPQEFISAAKYGYLYQGQWYSWQHQRRGRPAIDLEPSQFVNFMENHDQVANSLRGLRLNQIAGPGRLKAMTALLLLSPGTPMLFQGQEFWSSKPFLYFADHNPEIAAFVSNGRREFLSQFKSLANADTVPLLRDPHAFETFHACKLSVAERERNSGIVAFHRDLLRIRREHAAFTGPGRRCDGAVLGPEAFLLRFFADNDDDRLLLINLSCDLQLTIAPEPLLAPPFGCCWSVEWSSEDSKYGGGGSTPIECDGVWTLQGHAATLLAPVPVPS